MEFLPRVKGMGLPACYEKALAETWVPIAAALPAVADSNGCRTRQAAGGSQATARISGAGADKRGTRAGLGSLAANHGADELPVQRAAAALTARH